MLIPRNFSWKSITWILPEPCLNGCRPRTFGLATGVNASVAVVDPTFVKCNLERWRNATGADAEGGVRLSVSIACSGKVPGEPALPPSRQ